MKINFTKFDRPENALDLSLLKKSGRSESICEEAAQAGLDLGPTDEEYRLESCDIDLTFTKQHRVKFSAEEVTATLRPDQTLLSVIATTPSLKAEEIFKIAKPLVEKWGVYAVDVEADEGDEEDEDWEPTKLDPVQHLKQWKKNPPDVIPSYVAQSDPSPADGIAFLRLIIHCWPRSRFRLSAQVFWRSPTQQDSEDDEAFWARADTFIGLANEQSEDSRIDQVAKSMVYAAARYSSFDYWTNFEDRESFEESKQAAIDAYVRQFREMLELNMEDHSEQFES